MVQADSDNDGIRIGTGSLMLNGGTIRAVTADRTDASLGLGSNAITNLGSRRVDGSQFTAAAVSTAMDAVLITSRPADTTTNTYGLSERIEVQVTFTQRVDVTGTPQLALTIGTATRQADYASGSDSTTLTFHYVVQGAMSGGSGSGGVDSDNDGISIAANALDLNGGAINDARDATVAASLGLTAITNSANHKVDGCPTSLRQPTVGRSGEERAAGGPGVRNGRHDPGARDVRPSGDGDGFATVGADHRDGDAAGGVRVGVGDAGSGVPLRGAGRRHGRGRHQHLGERADAERRDDPARRRDRG